MKIVINKCYGGFGLSHKAVMRYAQLKKIKLYAYVEKRDDKEQIDLHHYIPYTRGKAWLIHYGTAPLNADGTIKQETYFSEGDIVRTDPLLVRTVKELGKEANGSCAELHIVTIPNNVEWTIEEYDGIEWVAEKHRTWR